MKIHQFLKSPIRIVTLLLGAVTLVSLYLFICSLKNDVIINGSSYLFGLRVSYILAALVLTLILLIFLINWIVCRYYKYILRPLNEVNSIIAEMGITTLDNEAGTYFKKAHSKISEIDLVLNNMKSLISLTEEINKSESFQDTLESAFLRFSKFIPYQLIGIALLSEDGKSLQAFHGISDERVKTFPHSLQYKKYNLLDTSLMRVVLTGEPRIINDLEKYTHGKPLKEYNRLILEAGIKSSVAHVLKVNGKPLGVIFFSSIYKNVYNESHIRFLGILANNIAISFNKSIQIRNIVFGSAVALAKLAESRDKDTGGHLERIKTYSGLLAELIFLDSNYKTQMSVDYVKDIEEFSPLHDIGKVSIQDSILLKPEELTSEERETMKQHTVFGAKILREAEALYKRGGTAFFAMGIEIAESHHEKWDGSGYPNGLKGEDIPLCARIVAIADVFDALTSRRPYKEAYDFNKACKIIMEGSGTHFDPEIVRIFNENISIIYKAYCQLHET